MKKFAKMSLVAAVAVAGLSSTVSAKDLSEAIKGVDFSGTVTYRYDEQKLDNTTKNVTNASPSRNTYKIVTNTVVPVNDNLTLNTQINVNGSAAAENTNGSANDAGNTTSDATTLTAREVYFTYSAIANTTVKVGKQAIDTPYTDAHDYIGGAGNGEQAGNGIVASVKAGPAVIGVQYFNNNDFTAATNGGALGSQDIWVASVTGDLDVVNLGGYYMAISDNATAGSKNGITHYTLDATAKVAGWSLYAGYTAVEDDQYTTDNKANILKLTAKGKVGPVGVKAGYAKTKDSKNSIKTAYDVDAKSNFLVWSTNSQGQDGYKGFYVGADMNVIPSTNIALVYADSSAVDGYEFSEIIGQVAYKMSKNFSTYLRYALQETKASTSADKLDRNRGRIQIQYSF